MNAGRVSEVLARLSLVVDPELDEPVTELGFVTDVSVSDDGYVTMGFRLPTYWCAANFSYLMADDLRRATLSLPWVSGVSVVLGEHMYAETINQAMASGQSFQEAFGGEADGDLEALRRVFEVKAFQRRQGALLDHLLAAGHAPEAVLALSIDGLRGLSNAPATVTLIAHYLQRRGVAGSAEGCDPAFVDAEGTVIAVETFADHRRLLRRVMVNTEFNGALCRGLLAARFAEDGPASGEPSLLDFVRGTVPEQRRSL